MPYLEWCTIMPEPQDNYDVMPEPDERLHLLSEELEEATQQFLNKVSELEKLLPLIEE